VGLIVEHCTTPTGCQVSRDSRGEFQALYYTEPPSGQGWHEVGFIWGADGEPRKVLWRRLKLEAGP
jgi:hypothetical protein